MTVKALKIRQSWKASLVKRTTESPYPYIVMDYHQIFRNPSLLVDCDDNVLGNGDVNDRQLDSNGDLNDNNDVIIDNHLLYDAYLRSDNNAGREGLHRDEILKTTTTTLKPQPSSEPSSSSSSMMGRGQHVTIITSKIDRMKKFLKLHRWSRKKQRPEAKVYRGKQSSKRPQIPSPTTMGKLPPNHHLVQDIPPSDQKRPIISRPWNWRVNG